MNFTKEVQEDVTREQALPAGIGTGKAVIVEEEQLVGHQAGGKQCGRGRRRF